MCSRYLLTENKLYKVFIDYEHNTLHYEPRCETSEFLGGSFKDDDTSFSEKLIDPSIGESIRLGDMQILGIMVYCPSKILEIVRNGGHLRYSN